jgi:hypothetical protein
MGDGGALPTPSPTPFPTPPSPPGGGSGTPSDKWTYGSTTKIKVVDGATFNSFVGHSTIDVTDLRINLNMVKIGDSMYAGHIKFGMTENGKYSEAYFTSGTTQNDAKYNVWLTNTTFHAFFQDEYNCNGSMPFCPYYRPSYGGGLIIVIDEFIDLGDGGGSTLASGSLWFQEFEFTGAPLSPTKCWNVTLGPYDCRTFLTGTSVNTTSSLYPNNGGPGGSEPRPLYRKFATFGNLDVNRAFNGTQPN